VKITRATVPNIETRDVERLDTDLQPCHHTRRADESSNFKLCLLVVAALTGGPDDVH
jgi:hypothetical protein